MFPWCHSTCAKSWAGRGAGEMYLCIWQVGGMHWCRCQGGRWQVCLVPGAWHGILWGSQSESFGQIHSRKTLNHELYVVCTLCRPRSSWGAGWSCYEREALHFHAKLLGCPQAVQVLPPTGHWDFTGQWLNPQYMRSWGVAPGLWTVPGAFGAFNAWPLDFLVIWITSASCVPHVIVFRWLLAASAARFISIHLARVRSFSHRRRFLRELTLKAKNNMIFDEVIDIYDWDFTDLAHRL